MKVILSLSGDDYRQVLAALESRASFLYARYQHESGYKLLQRVKDSRIRPTPREVRQ